LLEVCLARVVWCSRCAVYFYTGQPAAAESRAQRSPECSGVQSAASSTHTAPFRHRPQRSPERSELINTRSPLQAQRTQPPSGGGRSGVQNAASSTHAARGDRVQSAASSTHTAPFRRRPQRSPGRSELINTRSPLQASAAAESRAQRAQHTQPPSGIGRSGVQGAASSTHAAHGDRVQSAASSTHAAPFRQRPQRSPERSELNIRSDRVQGAAGSTHAARSGRFGGGVQRAASSTHAATVAHL